MECKYAINALLKNCSRYCYEPYQTAFDMAIEALEKQVPKEATFVRTNNIYGGVKRICPICGDEVMLSPSCLAEKYCRNCGQRFDVEDE